MQRVGMTKRDIRTSVNAQLRMVFLLPLLAAFAAVAVTVYICIWVLALCVWIVAVALGGVGVVELLLAVSGVIIGHFPYPLASAGVARPRRRGALRWCWRLGSLKTNCAPLGALGEEGRLALLEG